MRSDIDKLLEEAFESRMDQTNWDKLKIFFSQNPGKYVLESVDNFKIPDKTLKFNPTFEFEDHQSLLGFLEAQKKSAVKLQEFTTAGEIRDIEKEVKPDTSDVGFFYLHYQIEPSGDKVIIRFKSNLMGFRQQLLQFNYVDRKNFPDSDFLKIAKFWDAYIEKAKSKVSNLDLLWNSSKEWTNLVFGKDELAKDIEKNLNLGGKIFENRIWTEWRKFDLIIGSSDNFNDITGYDGSDLEKDDLLLSYPQHQLLILEHENDFKTCLNELIKLSYERARYKVLITYPESDEQRDTILNNSKRILEQSDTLLSEPESSYILVFGSLQEGIIHWEFYHLNNNGLIMGKYKLPLED